MTYTVQFDLDVDSDEIYDDDVVIGVIKECLRSANMDVENGRVIEVND